MKTTMAAEAKKSYKLAGNTKQLDVNIGRGTLKVTNEMLKNEKMVATLQKLAPKVFIKGLIVLA